MDYIRVTKENIENEHICCAISNNKDTLMVMGDKTKGIALVKDDVFYKIMEAMNGNGNQNK